MNFACPVKSQFPHLTGAAQGVPFVRNMLEKGVYFLQAMLIMRACDPLVYLPFPVTVPIA